MRRSEARRIAMVAACPFPAPRGTPTRILRMSEKLADRGHEVHVVAYHLGRGSASSALKVHRIRNVPGYRRISPGPSTRKLLQLDPMLAGRLRQVLDRYEIDVIHAHHYEGLLVGLRARGGAGIPIVYDAHTLLETELPSYRLGMPLWLSTSVGRWLDTTVPRRADHVVAVSDAIRQ